MYLKTFDYIGTLASAQRGVAAKDRDETRLLLKNGLVIDPKNGISEVCDIRTAGGEIVQVESGLAPEAGECVLDCEGLMVWPGLIDMHLHLGDLFEVSTAPITCAVQDGVTFGLSPGAGNTFMAPALLGAEVDRGLPLNLGVYLGAANVLATQLTQDELIKLFLGTLDAETASRKLTRNPVTNTTAALTIGIKDHMGHFIMPDESIERIFDLTKRANLVYMSHTQDPEHAERMAALSRGRALHLAHATAAGCGTHGSAEEGMERVLGLVGGAITAEFVSSMLRPNRGRREGARMSKRAQQLAYDALHAGKVRILVSDGQSQAVMKGFGDTRDDIPAILELAEMEVLTIEQAVASMTSAPAELLAQRTANDWWTRRTGNLGVGALANITVVDRKDKSAVYTIVNGEIASFEGRAVRRNGGAGGWVSKFGMHRRTGVGDLSLYTDND